MPYVLFPVKNPNNKTFDETAHSVFEEFEWNIFLSNMLLEPVLGTENQGQPFKRSLHFSLVDEKNWIIFFLDSTKLDCVPASYLIEKGFLPSTVWMEGDFKASSGFLVIVNFLDSTTLDCVPASNFIEKGFIPSKVWIVGGSEASLRFPPTVNFFDSITWDWVPASNLIDKGFFLSRVWMV